MSTATLSRPPLSTLDKGVLALHGLVAAVVGVVGFVQANDPGFATLQRIVIVMLVGLWTGGIITMGLIARYAIANRWGRLVLLLGGPFIGIAVVFGRTMLGMS